MSSHLRQTTPDKSGIFAVIILSQEILAKSLLSTMDSDDDLRRNTVIGLIDDLIDDPQYLNPVLGEQAGDLLGSTASKDDPNLKRLYTPLVARTEKGSLKKDSFPLTGFEWILEHKQSDDPITVVRKNGSSQVFALRELKQKDFDRIQKFKPNFEHENIVTAREFFHEKGSYYVLSDFTHISLHQVVQCSIFPSERQLSIILRQVSKSGFL